MNGTKKPTLEEEMRHLRTISLLDAGKLLGMSRATTYRRFHADEFPVPVREITGLRRVRVIDIEQLLED